MGNNLRLNGYSKTERKLRPTPREGVDTQMYIK